MTRTMPSSGDFVVEPHGRWHRAGERVVIVHLTADAQRIEVFSSCLPGSTVHAERLAATWALEDGTVAWMLVSTVEGERRFTQILTDVTRGPLGVVWLHAAAAPTSHVAEQ